MMSFSELDSLLTEKPFSLNQLEKEKKFFNAFKQITQWHYENCLPYMRLCDSRAFDVANFENIAEVPYVPASFFKEHLILSIPEDSVFREVKSSATTTGRSSRMGLDRQTSQRQTKCFNKIAIDRLGNKRRKFIVLDEPSSIGRSEIVTARASTIRPLLFFANEVQTCIEENNGELSLNLEILDNFLHDAEKSQEPVIIFGFTFILYIYVIEKLLKLNKKFHLPGSKIIHIGGWKKLESQKVTAEKLVEDCSAVFGVSDKDVVDLYGFTEQAGLIYPTCEKGLRHVPAWVEIIVRDPMSLEPLPMGIGGLLQFLSPIQTSYPGHSVLTEDVGFVVGVDNCECGRLGTTFKVSGRAPEAEIRGCGDIMAEKFA
jgi:phenylacetate-coenzyme A ligase PaaK-like adenylate-forming protein